MFGTYRTLLALMVVFFHLGGLPVLGAYAVFGFYMLSGYLMTLITKENYGFSRGGVARYTLNRFLRIYPIYWLSCLISLLVILVVGEHYAHAFHPALYWPSDWLSILRNVTIAFPLRELPRLTPPSWALTVELVFYGAIGLGLGRTRRLAVSWFIVSVGYTLIVNALRLSWTYRYSLITAASLPFSIGAVLYHFRRELGNWVGLVDRRFGGHLPELSFSCILANWWLGERLGSLKASTSTSTSHSAR